MKDSNLRRLSRRIYSPLPLATRATRLGRSLWAGKTDPTERCRRGANRYPGSIGGQWSGTAEVLETVADPSFDVVSKVDRQEVDNALNQAGKELTTRFDFRGTNASIVWAGDEAVTIQADTEERCAAAVDVFKEKLIKRGISLKSLEVDEQTDSGAENLPFTGST